MRTTKLLQTALAGAVALLAACNDSTGSGGSTAGSLSFNYSGDRVGTYSASGVYRPRGASFDKVPFAVGAHSQQPGNNVLLLLSYRPVTPSTGNMVLIGLPNVTSTGSYDLGDPTCGGTGGTSCPAALLAFDTDPDLEEDESEVFLFFEGTLNVTSISDGRMVGTFSGTAGTFDDRVITITNGNFDVPVRAANVLPNRIGSKHLGQQTRPQ